MKGDSEGFIFRSSIRRRNLRGASGVPFSIWWSTCGVKARLAADGKGSGLRKRRHRKTLELIFENLYDDGENFWFTEWEYNALFYMNKGEQSPKLAGFFPGEGARQKRLYSAMVLCNGKLFFAPYSAGAMAEYDPILQRFRKISLMAPRVQSGRLWEADKFYNVVSLEEKIYLIPYLYPGILVYDTETGKSVCIDDWVEEIENLSVGIYGYFKEVVQIDGKLVLPCMCADAVVILDVAEKRTEIMKTPQTLQKFKHCGSFFCRRILLSCVSGWNCFQKKISFGG